jgi:sodium/proline symporter
MLMSLFWKRTNKFGCIAGMIAGAIMVFVWKYGVRPLGGAWNLYELAPAFLVAIIFIFVVSLVTPAPEDDVVKTFEEVTSGSKAA